MKSILVMAVALATLACTRTEDTRERAADNTAVNQRDQDRPTRTPEDQRENAEDLTITQQIRKGVMAGDDISSDGKNVKIITVQGVVTLRGPVRTEQERTEIARVAKQVDGVKRVENQLEVAAK